MDQCDWSTSASQFLWDSDSYATRGHLRNVLSGQVRKTPSWPRSWANFSNLWLHSYGPTCIFWANLTPFSLQAEREKRVECEDEARQLSHRLQAVEEQLAAVMERYRQQTS